MTFLFCLLVLFSCGDLVAQVEPPDLSLLSSSFVEWTAQVSDDEIEDGFLFVDGAFSLRRSGRILYGDILIESYVYGISTGTYVVARDLTTGDLLWEQSYNLNTIALPELYSHMFIENGNLTLLGSKLSTVGDPFPVFGGWVVKRVLDLNTGETLEFYNPNQDSGFFIRDPSRFVLPFMDSSYIVANRRPFNSVGFESTIFELDNSVAFVDTINLLSVDRHKMSTSSMDAFIELSNDNYLVAFTSHIDANDLSTYVTELALLDSGANLLEWIDLTGVCPLTSINQLVEQNGQILIGGVRRTTNDGILNRDNCIIVLDLVGNVSLSTEFDEINGREPFESFVSYNSSSEDYIIVNQGLFDSCMVISVMDTGLTLIQSRQVCFPEKGWSFRPEFFKNFDQSLVVGFNLQKDTLIAHPFTGVISQERIGTFKGLVSISKPKLGLTHVDEATPDRKLAVYPNPTSDIFYLELDESFSGTYTIYNNIGFKVQSGKFHNSQALQFDLTEYESGIYFVSIRNEMEVLASVPLVKE